MLEVRAREFVTAITNLSQLQTFISAVKNNKDSAFHKDQKLEATDREFLIPRLKSFTDNLASVSSPITKMAAEEGLAQIAQEGCDWENVQEVLADINKTLKRELTKITLLSLDSEEKDLFECAAPPFGETVHTAFKSSRYDIEEAAKCLALDRGTACVFHVSRALEAPLHCLLNELGIVPPPNWNKGLNDFDSTLTSLQEKLKSNSAEKPKDWEEKEQFYSEASAHLRNVKNAWRNDATHIGIKYTPEEAGRIFWAVEDFFVTLATRLCEPSEEQPA